MADTIVNDATFAVQAAPVVDVTLIPEELGAIVVNEADGFMYFCDIEGWKKLEGAAI